MRNKSRLLNNKTIKNVRKQINKVSQLMMLTMVNFLESFDARLKAFEVKAS